MSHEEIVDRAARAVRDVMARIRTAGRPPTSAQIREAVMVALAAESEELEGLQAVVLDYLRQAEAVYAEADDLLHIAEVWSAGRLCLPVTADGIAAHDRRREVARLKDAILAAGVDVPALPVIWASVEALCETALPASPPVALTRAAEAVRIARALPDYDETRNLLAYALAHYANGFYRAGDLERAGALFAEMESHAAIIGDGPEWDDDLEGYCPLALLLTASYFRTVRQLPLALDHQIDALGLLTSVRTRPPRPKLLAKNLMVLAQSLYELGHAWPARGILVACRPLFPYLDADLIAGIQHNLAATSLEIGDLATARQALERAQQSREAEHQTRFTWTRARLALEEGRTSEGLDLLGAVRDRFLEEGSRYDVGLVSLELAELYAEAGDTEAVKGYAGEAIRLFAGPGCDREVLVAIGYLSGCMAAETAAALPLAAVRAYLSRARWDQKHRFHPPPARG